MILEFMLYLKFNVILVRRVISIILTNCVSKTSLNIVFVNFKMLWIFILFLRVNFGLCHRYVEPAQVPETVWQRLLQTISNGTGHVYPDPTFEFLIRQGFKDFIQPKVIENHELLGLSLDPFALFPVGPIQWKKKLSRGEVTACHLHLHNLKRAELV